MLSANSEVFSIADISKGSDSDGENGHKREPLGLLNEENLPWGNIAPFIRFKEAETSEAILDYRDSEQRLFGYEDSVTYSVVKGEVTQGSVESLIASGLAKIDELKNRENLTVFDNVPIANAKIIFSEAEKALKGDATYNRMLWAAIGLSFKEWVDKMPNYILRKKIEAYINVDIGEEGIWFSGYPDTEERLYQLNKFENSVGDKAKELRSWLEKNYAIPDYEKTIKTPLDR